MALSDKSLLIQLVLRFSVSRTNVFSSTATPAAAIMGLSLSLLFERPTSFGSCNAGPCAFLSSQTGLRLATRRHRFFLLQLLQRLSGTECLVFLVSSWLSIKIVSVTFFARSKILVWPFPKARPYSLCSSFLFFFPSSLFPLHSSFLSICAFNHCLQMPPRLYL